MFASPGRLLTPAVEGFSPQAQAVISAMSPAPSPARQVVINNLVDALLRSGTWDLIGVLYVYAAHASGPSLLNWKNPSGTPAAATAAFTVDGGYNSDGSSTDIDTQAVYNAIPGLTRNDAHVGTVATYTGAAATVVGLIAQSNFTTIRNGVGNFITTRAHHGTENASAVLPVPTGTRNHLSWSRQLSTEYRRFVNGSPETVAVASSADPTAENWRGLRNGATYSSAGNRIHAQHAGAGMTNAQMLAVSNALLAYMTAVGVP